MEKRPSNPTTAKDYDLLASAIKMGEEDRMALMIMVKQGELTVEEAVEQLKRWGVHFFNYMYGVTYFMLVKL